MATELKYKTFQIVKILSSKACKKTLSKQLGYWLHVHVQKTAGKEILRSDIDMQRIKNRERLLPESIRMNIFQEA
jgi:hypothetical protein